LNWLEIFYGFTDLTNKTLDMNSIMALIAKVCHNPVLSSVPDPIAYVADYMLLLKTFEFSCQGLSPEDWMFETQINTIHRQITDKMVADAMKSTFRNFTDTQIRAPADMIGNKFQLKIAPITNRDFDYSPSSNPGRSMDKKIFDHCPSVSFNPLRYDQADKKSTFKFPNITCINAAEKEAKLSYQSVFGTMMANDIVQDAYTSIDVVFPATLMRIYRDRGALLMEKRHWPILYLNAPRVNPPLSLARFPEMWLYGLSTLTGPNLYLINPTRLVQNTTIFTAHFDGEEYKLPSGIFNPNIEAVSDNVDLTNSLRAYLVEKTK
jgi:hypothetical protein